MRNEKFDLRVQNKEVIQLLEEIKDPIAPLLMEKYKKVVKRERNLTAILFAILILIYAYSIIHCMISLDKLKKEKKPIDKKRERTIGTIWVR